jgi:hypothetical protein
MDPAVVRERQRGIWGLGDYSYVSRVLRPAAVALVVIVARRRG